MSDDRYGELTAERIWSENLLNDPFPAKVRHILDDIHDTLIKKNAAYGNSALDPVRIFSTAGPTEQLKVRIDDKLSRIAKGHDYDDEDTLRDLIG